MTLVTVCGLTRAEDVRLATELGAWALGFVVAESPRQVDAARAAELIATLAPDHPLVPRSGAQAAPAPLPVLVVTTESAEWIAEALEASRAGAVQLSAGPDGPSVAEVRAATARLRRQPVIIAAADTRGAGRADFVLLDARTSSAYGGTGETLDWEAQAADPVVPPARLVLAGGLRPGNAGTAIRTLHPAAVDVSSGVEAAPGRKDHDLLREFFAAVEHADREAEAAGADHASLPAAQP